MYVYVADVPSLRYIYGLRLGREWLVRIGVYVGGGATIQQAMHNALMNASNGANPWEMER